jgi:hypothetical protein
MIRLGSVVTWVTVFTMQPLSVVLSWAVKMNKP